MKHIFRCATLYVVVFSMTMVTPFMTACGKNADTPKDQETEPSKTVEALSKTDKTVEGTTEDDMKSPEVKPNEIGLIVLEECPTTYQNLRVEVAEDYSEAKIFDGDKLLQTISAPEDGLVAAGGEVPVYFLDANFDGYVDIFIGPGVSRTYSTLLIWNPANKQFVRVGTLGTPTLQNFMLYPSGKNVFDGGSESAFADFFTRYEWKEGELQKLNDLYVVNDPEQYIEYGVEAKYTFRDADDKVILSTNKLTDLPTPWADVLKTYFE